MAEETPPLPALPFWFKQRQCKAEHQGGLLKVSGPNLGEAFLHVESAAANTWRAGLRLTADAADVATAEAVGPTAKVAWEAAFELYRSHVIV